MPPECFPGHPVYNSKLDIFSFGVLVIHTVIGSYPIIAHRNRRTDEEIPEGSIELMRRNAKKWERSIVCILLLLDVSVITLN